MRARTAMKWRGLVGVAVGLAALWGGRAWADGTPYPVTFDISQFGFGDGPTAVAVADFNGDGKLDLAVADANGNNVNIFLNSGSGFPAVASHTLTGNASAPLKSPQGIVARETTLDPSHLNDVPNGIGADFNGDGKVDFAVTNYNGKSVSVFLGNGDGTFTGPTNYAVPKNPLGIAAARLRGASAGLDLVVVADTTVSGGTITVLRNTDDHTGNFVVQSSIPVGSKPRRIAIGDFGKPGYPLTYDGVADLAVTLYGNNAIAVLYGNGDGTFVAVNPPFETDPGPNGIVVADFNNDGYPDLATANHKGYTNTADVLLGHDTSANASFGSPARIATFGSYSATYGITSLKLDGDNKIDLAVTNSGVSGTKYDKLELLQNTMDLINYPGSAVFARVDCYADNGPKGVVAADFNGDGIADMAVANQVSDDVSILYGTGSVTCPTPVQIGVKPVSSPVSVALCNVTDATGNPPADTNGILDLLVADGSTDGVVFFGGDGHGNFTRGETWPVPSCTGVSSIVCNDCGGFTVTCKTSHTAYAYCPSGGCNQPTSGPIGAGELNDPVQIVYANLDGAAPLDWAIANNGNNTLAVSCSPLLSTLTQPISVAAGSFHGFCSVTVQTKCKTSADCPTNETCIRPTDLVLASSYTNTVQAFFNDGACHLTAGAQKTVGYKPGSSTLNNPVWVTTADINGDSLADIITANWNKGTDTVSVLSANGNGDFSEPQVYTVGSNPVAAVAADFNRDNYPDVAVAENAGDVVSLLLGGSSGTLSNCPDGTSCCEYAGGTGPIAIQAGNINNLDDPDGVPDLVVVDAGEITVLVNTTPPTCPATQCCTPTTCP